MGRRNGLGINNKNNGGYSTSNPRGLERVDSEVSNQMAGKSTVSDPESKRNKQLDEQFRKAMGG